MRSGAVSVSAWSVNVSVELAECNSPMRPLPAEFLAALDAADAEEILVTSREAEARGTVPVWFVVAPPGVVYLFGFAFSEKARRWRTDSWVRLTVPGTRTSAEGVVHFVSAEDVDPELAELLVARWEMQGAPTPEGLRRTLRDKVHVLVRVEGSALERAPD